MKITGTLEPDGKMVSQVDFEDATLPSGENIQSILQENNALKGKVASLQHEIDETSSILVHLIPNRTVRNIVEFILVVGTIWGITTLFWMWPRT